MSRLVSSISRTWNWRAKISQVLEASEQINGSRPPSAGELVVRVDKRSPTPSPTDRDETLEIMDDSVWPSEQLDVMTSGERFGVSHEDLTSISDKMNCALERFENFSQSERSGESFDSFMNSIEEKISALYEEYEALIGNTSLDNQGRLNFGELDPEVRPTVAPYFRLMFGESLSS